ncbi:MAG: class I SAM-dependent methyltransferase [Dehalococcoidia bacterium]|nr:class I SAM-dependent methyltransferase [Dehalococcoidia bacterium]
MQLNQTFNTVAELYDRARPRYPRALYDDLARLTGIGADARVLEIAPATGIVTLPLAERGYSVTAIEMGADLARVARRNLAGFPNARVEVSRFEDYPLEAASFDLVCCATAFSWLDPAVRVEKCALALRPGGFLGVWDTHHVAGGTGQFFVDSQECYERWMPGTEPGIRLEPAVDIVPKSYGLESHPAFEAPVIRDYVVEIPYTTETYLDVLQTYSGHIALEPENADGLYRCIRELIDNKYGGHIEKAYLFQLILARRR